VADTSVRYDREIKVPLYARHGIPAVWLVDLESGSLTTYSDPRGNGYHAMAQRADPQAAAVPGVGGVAVDLSKVFGQ
jgi:Uma2 family endonuclease